MEWFSKNRSWLACIGFFAVSATLRFLAVNQTPHPSGWDGYYYVMQVHSWITFGHLQAPDYSLIYPYFTAIALITGNVILAFKIGVAILAGLLIVAVFYALHKRSVPFGWICIACSYLVFSPLITYFVLQFPKNVLGLIFLLLLISNLQNRIVAFLLLIATVMTHRMTGGFAIVATAVYAIKYIPWKWIAIGSLVLVAISFLPGIIHISDLQRFADQFDVIPHWSPLAFAQIFPQTLNLFFKADLLLISLLIVYATYRMTREKKDINTWIWLPIALLSIFPFFHFSAGNAGHRFFLIAPVAFIMLMPYGEKSPRITWALVPIVLLVSFFSTWSYKPSGFDPPNGLYERIVVKLSERYKPGNYPLVIAHQPLAEMIIFRTDFDALNWLPPKDMAPDNVLRLANGVQYSSFRQYLDGDDMKKVRPIAPGYFVAPEDVWQQFVQNALKDNDEELMNAIYKGMNPMDERPYFITKGRRR